jgi:hypothetical protein
MVDIVSKIVQSVRIIFNEIKVTSSYHSFPSCVDMSKQKTKKIGIYLVIFKDLFDKRVEVSLNTIYYNFQKKKTSKHYNFFDFYVILFIFYYYSNKKYYKIKLFYFFLPLFYFSILNIFTFFFYINYGI